MTPLGPKGLRWGPRTMRFLVSEVPLKDSEKRYKRGIHVDPSLGYARVQCGPAIPFLYFITLDAGPRRPLSFELGDTKHFEPQVQPYRVTLLIRNSPFP